ncbi:hypothetical protein ERJ75_000727400 [Trypanosoma vivax]|nr:23S rRNA (cytosine1962-C5)-methyltransferase [Trypanosoma vivax]KAH8613733.1 hypothetical protein ERJ75_000727400 [Trypanosoma vivax]
MLSSLLSPLLAYRLTAGQKFPQLQLRVGEQLCLTHQRQSFVPLTSINPHSLDFARRELAPGSVVELREADHHRLLGLGFYEPSYLRVDVFQFTPRRVVELPTVSEEFFLDRVREAWDRRKRVLSRQSSGATNTYRVVNGAADGVPGLYVDIFSPSYARVVATTHGSERLVPSVAEMLRCKGVEQLLLHSPHLKDREKLNLSSPTVSLPSCYMENGASHLWVPREERPTTTSNRWLVNTSHRRARLLLREVCSGKRVMCINDRGGAAALQAVMSAKSVIVAESDTSVLDRVRENLVANHGKAVFGLCETTCAAVNDLTVRKQDVVYIDHHPEQLLATAQWHDTMDALLKRGVCGGGTIVFVAQEAAPLGIPDLVETGLSHSSAAAQREDLMSAIRLAVSDHHLTIRSLRCFGPSVDHPVLPAVECPCFAQVFLLEGSV